MPTFTLPPPNPSTTATAAASSASTPSEVSFTFESIKQFADAFFESIRAVTKVYTRYAYRLEYAKQEEENC